VGASNVASNQARTADPNGAKGSLEEVAEREARRVATGRRV